VRAAGAAAALQLASFALAAPELRWQPTNSLGCWRGVALPDAAVKRPTLCSQSKQNQCDTLSLRRVQTMALGGNQRGRQFFKQHGWYELGADKIEAKVGALPNWDTMSYSACQTGPNVSYWERSRRPQHPTQNPWARLLCLQPESSRVCLSIYQLASSLPCEACAAPGAI
jgi:hypothetical protein